MKIKENQAELRASLFARQSTPELRLVVDALDSIIAETNLEFRKGRDLNDFLSAQGALNKLEKLKDWITKSSPVDRLKTNG